MNANKGLQNINIRVEGTGEPDIQRSTSTGKRQVQRCAFETIFQLPVELVAIDLRLFNH